MRISLSKGYKIDTDRRVNIFKSFSRCNEAPKMRGKHELIECFGTRIYFVSTI